MVEATIVVFWGTGLLDDFLVCDLWVVVLVRWYTLHFRMVLVGFEFGVSRVCCSKG